MDGKANKEKKNQEKKIYINIFDRVNGKQFMGAR